MRSARGYDLCSPGTEMHSAHVHAGKYMCVRVPCGTSTRERCAHVYAEWDMHTYALTYDT